MIKRAMSLRIPTATYRLQLNHLFTFKDALDIVPYLHELGISDIYTSPLTKAVPGSVHGYDVVDCTQINPEIGTEEELEALASSLRSKKMGLLVDIVPNHMSISGTDNKWWQDVLENGPCSLYADYFNISWNPPQVKLKGKVLLPVLDRPFGKVIEGKELQLAYETGSFYIEYKDKRFPVNPLTWALILKPAEADLLLKVEETDPSLLELQSIITAIDHLPTMEEKDPEKCKERNREKEIIKKRLMVLVESDPNIWKAIQHSIESLNGTIGDPHSFDLLEDLLDAQAYRLSFWRVTNDEINYHRFFDVNELISMRVENEAVFEEMHELILRYIRNRWITGLRIDHVDGLFDPEQYFVRLQEACSAAFDVNLEPTERHFYLVAEKILGHQEKLRSRWQIFGTTGYDVLNLLNACFVEKESKTMIHQIYERFAGRFQDMEDEIFFSKKLILIVSKSSELHILARSLDEVSEQHRWSRDYTFEALRLALRDIIACFPCYRSYIRPLDSSVKSDDREMIVWAVSQAKKRNPVQDPSIFEFIQSVLLLDDPPGLTEEQIYERRQFVMHFQQLTGPIAAKGIEDTALYRYFPLASLNEVGMDPDAFGIDTETFHQLNEERLRLWPHTLSATSTHDTKRSEEVRCRINVLSEIPAEWMKALERWNSINASQKEIIERREVPDRNEEYLLYQTLIGTWPTDAMDSSQHASYVERIEAYMIKAIKEAKIRTSWIHPNASYEEGMRSFIRKILAPSSENPFLTDFQKFTKPITDAGLYNSLSQTLLKITCPGIPDLYQGSELLQFNLVDPDNRRTVDFSNRLALLQDLMHQGKSSAKELVTDLRGTLSDGRLKLYLTAKCLQYRQKKPLLFQQGDYLPIDVQGTRENQAIAFGRIFEGDAVIVAAGRFFTKFSDEPIGNAWKDTSLNIPKELHGTYQDILTGKTISLQPDLNMAMEEVFECVPISMLVRLS